jgi:MYXO-CTERM domain-containing protein
MRRRHRTVHLLKLAAAAVLLCSAPPSGARAYCRTTTLTPMSLRCDQPCTLEGIPLDWAKPCIGYSLNVLGARALEPSRVAPIADRSFARWTTGASCAAGAIGVSVVRHPDLVTCDVDHYSSEGGNVNVLAFVGDWDERDYAPSAFALTQTKYVVSSGRIVDADLLFNEEFWEFAECPEAGCTDGRVDLENTLVHEAGHFLGLSHSPDETSVMWGCGDPGDTSKRELQADDLAGICSIYAGRVYGDSCDPTPRGGLDGSCPAVAPSDGCAVRPGGAAPIAPLAIVLLFWLRRRP